ncbi:hypothetical protein PVK06_047615 [Gossypium arboreum]|uniref:Uncharacterized protein n=1 Tax=Gossypium arboreum TaxID=29729 RepID=A0ABR0ME86_GOSAR|nr:hypothetical protein PVK06_047615 [Gossypium arboreum]
MRYRSEPHTFYISCRDGIIFFEAYPKKVSYVVILLSTVNGGSRHGGLNRQLLLSNGLGAPVILEPVTASRPLTGASTLTSTPGRIKYYYLKTRFPHDGFLR